jgi:hypothetical protein
LDLHRRIADSCTSSGGGGFTDVANIPANASQTWLVSVPTLAGSNESSATLTVGQSAPTGIGVPDVSDTNTLVIFRDGYDVPYADGTQGTGLIDLLSDHSVSIEWQTGADGVRGVQVFRASDALIELQGLSWQGAEFLRLLATNAQGKQQLSEWAAVDAGAQIVLGRVTSNGSDTILLEGALRPLTLSPIETSKKDKSQ